MKIITNTFEEYITRTRLMEGKRPVDDALMRVALPVIRFLVHDALMRVCACVFAHVRLFVDSKSRYVYAHVRMCMNCAYIYIYGFACQDGFVHLRLYVNVIGAEMKIS
eukprot:GHVS01069622.1.p1 GENE.GHVS01069622.1~~GHVS01069622.1.p1  ORF type:complete len:108 (+),score=2.47 GHVS01069622.1:129-452(+)